MTLEVNHKDGNKKNNHLDNLEWMSHDSNMEHAHKNKLVDNHKFTSNEVRLMRKYYNNGTFKVKELVILFGAARSTIWRVVTHRAYKEVT